MKEFLLSVGLALLACGKTKAVDAEPPARISVPPPSPTEAPRTPSSTELTASGGAAQEPRATVPRKRYRVAALGDSITDQSVGGGLYLRELERACPASRFDHFGRGGDMTSQMRRRFERDFLPVAGEYDTLIVYGGVNDLYSNLTAGRTNSRIEDDLGAIYAQAKERSLRVVAITVSPWGGFRKYFNSERSQNTRLLNAWILGSPARGETDVVIDSYPLLSCGDPERLCPAYESQGKDGLHPGPAGHAILAKALLARAFADCE